MSIICTCEGKPVPWEHIGGCSYPDCHCPVKHKAEYAQQINGEPWPEGWDGRDRAAFNRALGVKEVPRG